MDAEVHLESISERGQFRVLVDGQIVHARRGGLFAKLLRKPWPEPEEVVAAVMEAVG